jgi:DNA-binding beta-propeller fold protein YncE
MKSAQPDPYLVRGLGSVVIYVSAVAANAGSPLTDNGVKAFFSGPPLESPIGVRCHPDGRVFVVDDHAHRVFVFDPNGALLQSLGGFGVEGGKLLYPDAMHWDRLGRLYVADTGANRIQIWEGDGRFVREFGREPRVRQVFRVAVPAAALLLLLTYTVAAGMGILPAAWWSSPASLALVLAGAVSSWLAVTALTFEGLRNPRDVLVGPNGLVYVSDFGADRVRVFRPDGVLLRSIGRPGSGRGELRKPLGLALLGDDRLFVADSKNHRVVVFGLDGTFLETLGSSGSALGEFESPHGLFVESDRTLHVTDRGNRRLQTWAVVRGQRKASRVRSAVGLAPSGLCATASHLLIADSQGGQVLMVPRDLGRQSVDGTAVSGPDAVP